MTSRLFSVKSVIIAFTALIVFSVFPVSAELFSSSHYGWTLDLPEGFRVSEAGKDGASFFLEHDFMPVRIAIKLYPKSRYETNDKAMEEVLNALGADGDIDGFMWHGRKASISQYSFTIPGNKTAQSGWGASVTLSDAQTQFVLLCYTDKSLQNDSDQFILSVLDSLVINPSDFRRPGIITSYAFPATEKEDVEIEIAGKKVFTQIEKDAAEAARFTVDREFAVLTLYANQKSWKEAWQRYYRLIFKDSYQRLNDAAADIYSAIYPDALSKNPQNTKYEVTQTLLTWVQGFDYEREKNKADFADLISTVKGGGSDCDSRSLLLCTILEHFGVKTELFVSREYSHAVFGAAIEGKGAHITVDGVSYLLGETTAKVNYGLIAAEHSDTEKWIPVDLP